MNAASRRLVLASGSPRRRDILSGLGLDFEVDVPDVDELASGDPRELVLANAGLKARTVRERAVGDAIVIACDTDVALDGEVLGKPADLTEARASLGRLSGRTHEVLGGLVALLPGEEPRSALEISRVRFRELDETLVDLYLASNEWRGKAGGYAIQGLGSMLVAAFEGDFSNIVGLPIRALRATVPELFAATSANAPKPWS
ncbi:septum formation protein Maf [Thermoleophilia bacterium SCSIO 60948]|nr:septum formation protein Maf [Thermoleophilia bacterium SCSIO 60948]